LPAIGGILIESWLRGVRYSVAGWQPDRSGLECAVLRRDQSGGSRFV